MHSPNDYLPSPYCCCCMPIRCGVVTMGGVELVFLSLSLASRIYYLVEPEKLKELIIQENGNIIADPVISNQDVSGI